MGFVCCFAWLGVRHLLCFAGCLFRLLLVWDVMFGCVLIWRVLNAGLGGGLFD